MSRIRIVKGKYTKIIGDNYFISAEGNIVSNAQREVRDNGIEKGVLYSEYDRVGSNVSDDFQISFSLKKDKAYSTVVPFGILDFEGNYENANIVFDYTLMLGNVDSMEFKILDEDGNALYAITNLPTVVVSSRRVPLLVEDIFRNKPKYDPLKPVKVWDIKSIFDPYNISSGDYTKIGSYVIFWDGFDNNDIYDSTNFNNKKLTAQITATKNGIKKTKEVQFSTEQIKVDWVDVIINRKAKKIDTTLRVNLKDGGTKGLNCNNRDIDPDPKISVPLTTCDWDNISNEALNFFKKEPLKTRTRSLEDLKNMALDGINTYWSRTDNRTQGKGTNINGEKWEIIVNAVNDQNGMAAPKVIYFTNSKNSTFNRSHNWELHRELYYKVGYTYYPDSKDGATKDWYYRESSIADLIFKETSAHEIGHQILFEFGGRTYSYNHKGTSGPTWLQQDPLSGTKYGAEEIDLMKYAEEKEPQDYHDRLVLSQEDSLSIVWLTKIKILSLILLFSTIYSCQYNKAEAQERKKVEYFNGIVVDLKKNVLSGVNVVCILKKDSSNLRTTITDTHGNFKFWDPKFDKLKIEEGAKLIFSKEGYISDTVETTQPAPEFKKYPNNYFFIHKEPDTLILKKVTRL